MRKTNYIISKSTQVILQGNSIYTINSKRDKKTDIKIKDIKSVKLFSQMGNISCIIKDILNNKIHIYFTENLSDEYRGKSQGTKDEFDKIVQNLHLKISENSDESLDVEFVSGMNLLYYTGIYLTAISLIGVLVLITAQSVSVSGYFIKVLLTCFFFSFVGLFFIFQCKDQKEIYNPREIPQKYLN